jgi:hypothetical protein
VRRRLRSRDRRRRRQPSPSPRARNQAVRFCARLSLISCLTSFFCNSETRVPRSADAGPARMVYIHYNQLHPAPTADAAASTPPATPDAASRAPARTNDDHLSLLDPIVEGAWDAVVERHRAHRFRAHGQPPSGDGSPEQKPAREAAAINQLHRRSLPRSAPGCLIPANLLVELDDPNRDHFSVRGSRQIATAS